jgi:hypothetical protein
MMPVLKGKTPPPVGGASFAKEAGEERIQTPALFRKRMEVIKERVAPRSRVFFSRWRHADKQEIYLRKVDLYK